MKKKTFLNFFLCLFFFGSCAYEPIYKKKSIFSHKINILVKSNDYDKKIPLFMKASLNQKLNSKRSKPSNLKLVVSLSRSLSGLAFNKDLYSSGKILNINLQYTFYDKKGVVLSGTLQNKSSYFLGESPSILDEIVDGAVAHHHVSVGLLQGALPVFDGLAREVLYVDDTLELLRRPASQRRGANI